MVWGACLGCKDASNLNLDCSIRFHSMTWYPKIIWCGGRWHCALRGQCISSPDSQAVRQVTRFDKEKL